eukprot:snap_masked-scaffold_10-processed-gene-12.46-mRNA-1 protein AED:1.00 eAED:1.00 QI:0/0/0/0/1/1/2/0/419
MGDEENKNNRETQIEQLSDFLKASKPLRNRKIRYEWINAEILPDFAIPNIVWRNLGWPKVTGNILSSSLLIPLDENIIERNIFQVCNIFEEFSFEKEIIISLILVIFHEGDLELIKPYIKKDHLNAIYFIIFEMCLKLTSTNLTFRHYLLARNMYNFLLLTRNLSTKLSKLEKKYQTSNKKAGPKKNEVDFKENGKYFSQERFDRVQSLVDELNPGSQKYFSEYHLALQNFCYKIKKSFYRDIFFSLLPNEKYFDQVFFKANKWIKEITKEENKKEDIKRTMAIEENDVAKQTEIQNEQKKEKKRLSFNSPIKISNRGRIVSQVIKGRKKPTKEIKRKNKPKLFIDIPNNLDENFGGDQTMKKARKQQHELLNGNTFEGINTIKYTAPKPPGYSSRSRKKKKFDSSQPLQSVNPLFKKK